MSSAVHSSKRRYQMIDRGYENQLSQRVRSKGTRVPMSRQFMLFDTSSSVFVEGY